MLVSQCQDRYDFFLWLTDVLRTFPHEAMAFINSGNKATRKFHTEPLSGSLLHEIGTASQYLAVHRAPVSETASRQHLRSAACHHLAAPPHRRSTLWYIGRSLSLARRRGTCCLNVYVTFYSTPVFGRILKTFFSLSTIQGIRGFGDYALYKFTFTIL